MKITKQQAQTAWDIGNPKGFYPQFDAFEDYWEDCEKFNNLPSEQQEEQKRTALDKLKL